jgi:hypothetical protein
MVSQVGLAPPLDAQHLSRNEEAAITNPATAILVSYWPFSHWRAAMRFSCLNVMLIVVAILTSVGSAKSQDSAKPQDPCDPVSFLQPETFTSVTDVTTRLSYVDKYLRQKDKTRDTSFLGDFYSVYGITNLDVRSAERTNEQIKSLLDIRLDQRKQDWLLISTLSKTGADAYKECLKTNKKAVSVIFSQNAMLADAFFIALHSHPNTPTQNSLPFEIKAINGSVEKQGQATLSGSIVVQSFKSIAIYRDLSRPLDLSITVGPDVELVSFPASPNKTLTTIFRSSEPFDYKLEDTVADIGPKPYCVKLNDDEQEAFIVPGSISLKFDDLVQNEGLAVDCHNQVSNPYCKSEHKHKEQTRESCAWLFMHLSTRGGVARAKGRAEAQIVKTVPVKK